MKLNNINKGIEIEDESPIKHGIVKKNEDLIE